MNGLRLFSMKIFWDNRVFNVLKSSHMAMIAVSFYHLGLLATKNLIVDFDRSRDKYRVFKHLKWCLLNNVVQQPENVYEEEIAEIHRQLSCISGDWY